MLWINSPYLDINYLAGQLYGNKSRFYAVRLRKKIQGEAPFESWEIEKLSHIKQELISNLNPN
jgi:hypothetical protein